MKYLQMRYKDLQTFTNVTHYNPAGHHVNSAVSRCQQSLDASTTTIFHFLTMAIISTKSSTTWLPYASLQIDHPRPRVHAHLLTTGSADVHVHVPKVDIRENDKAFFVALELPSVTSLKAVNFLWYTAHTLCISGKLGYEETAIWQQDEETGKGMDQRLDDTGATYIPTTCEAVEIGNWPLQRIGAIMRHLGHAKHGTSATQLFALKEGKMRLFERQIVFPVKMDTEKLQASLDNGLLKIVVPKRVKEVSECRHDIVAGV